MFMRLAPDGPPLPGSFLETFSLRDVVCFLSWPGVDCTMKRGGGGSLMGGASRYAEGYTLSVSIGEVFELLVPSPDDFDAEGFSAAVFAAVGALAAAAGLSTEVETPESGPARSLRYAGASCSGEIALALRIAGDWLFLELNGEERGSSQDSIVA
jgi:hypothetical protein